MAVLNQELTGPADPTAGHPWLSQKTKSPLMPCATTAGCRIWTWFLPTHLHMPWLRLGLFPPPKHDLFVGKGQTKGTENSGKNPNPTFCFPWSPLFHFIFATKQPSAFFFFFKVVTKFIQSDSAADGWQCLYPITVPAVYSFHFLSILSESPLCYKQ